MDYNVEVASPTQRKITVTLPVQEVNAAMDAAIRKLGANLSLDGFRKGKVPANVIEKRYEQEIISDSTDSLTRQAVSDILEQDDLYPVNQIKVDGTRVVRNQDYSFSFSFEVLPDIDLPQDLTSLSVEVESDALTDEEVAELTTRVRRMMASLEEVKEDRLPVDNDIVLIDVEATHNGQPVPSMSSQNFLMHLLPQRTDSKPSEVERIVRTLKAGQNTEEEITLPADHPEPSLRDKLVSIKLKLHAINTEILPELNDDMAAKMGFENLAKLQDAITAQAQSNKSGQNRNKAQQRLLDKLLQDLDIALPESMVNTRLEEYMSEARDQLLKQGLSTEAVASALEDLKEEGITRAKVRAKEQAFLMALAQREKIQVQDLEVEQQIQRLAQQSGQDYQTLSERLWQSGVAFTLQDRLLMAKAMEYLFNQAQKITVDRAEGKAEGAEAAPAKTKKAKDKA